MENLFLWFMAAVVGLLLAIRSDLKEIKNQITVKTYERNGLFKKPLRSRPRKGPEVAKPETEVPRGDSGRD